jgi:hypothetical protein
MRLQRVLVVVAAVLLAGGGRPQSHHSFAAEFDANRPVTLTGTVAKVAWTNPHTFIFVEVKARNGTVVTWTVEGGPPNALFRGGLNRNSLPVGTPVVIEGYRAKNNSNTVNGRKMSFGDGKAFSLGSSYGGAEREARKP